MKVPFVNVAGLHEPQREEILSAFARVLDSGGYVQGREVAGLEEEFSQAYGGTRAVAVANGTAALHLALLACGVRPGDEVITVANTFIATAEAITMVQATPVFVDVDPVSLTMDPEALEAAIGPRTSAIIPVHLYGRLAPMSRIMAIAERHGLKVIEDACQAHGAVTSGELAGTIGHAGCLSFYPTKNLGTVGEGGMVLTRDAAIAQRVASLRHHAQSSPNCHGEPGFNYRMSELQAAAVRVFLPHLNDWNAGRIRAAGHYETGLAGSGISTPGESPEGEHVYHLYVVRSGYREELRERLHDRGIGTAIHYPTPIHLQPAYSSERWPAGSLPNTEKAGREIVSLPMHPAMSREDVGYVCSQIAAFMSGRGGPV